MQSLVELELGTIDIQALYFNHWAKQLHVFYISFIYLLSQETETQ